MPYFIVPRTENTVKADKHLIEVQHWLETLERPDALSDAEYKMFMQYCTEFFIFNGKLWHKDAKVEHKMVIAQEQHIFLMSVAHNDVEHHGVYTMSALLTENYWWPYMAQDISWFILSCHLC